MYICLFTKIHIIYKLIAFAENCQRPFFLRRESWSKCRFIPKVGFSNRFPLSTISHIKWTVVCKTTGKEEAGPPHWETLNPAPQDECWMKNKNVLHSCSAPFTEVQTSCYLSHIRLLLCVDVCGAVRERDRQRDLFYSRIKQDFYVLVLHSLFQLLWSLLAYFPI